MFLNKLPICYRSYPLPTDGVSANYILNTLIIYCCVRILDLGTPLGSYLPSLDYLSIYHWGYIL